MTNEELFDLFRCGASKLAMDDDPGTLLGSALSWHSAPQPTSTGQAFRGFVALRAGLLERHGEAAAEIFDGLIWSSESVGLPALVETVVTLTQVEPDPAS